MKRNLIATIFLSLIFLPILMLLDSCGMLGNKQENAAMENAYVGPEKCAQCHSQQHLEWKQSDHYKSMELATDSSVLGDFNTEFVADGVKTIFSKKEGKYIINTEGEDGKNHDFLVKYTFGYSPLQQYLIEMPGGRLQAARVSWDSEKKKWFNQYPNENIHYKDWLHWTGNGQNWNTMCASCHSTQLLKNYQFESDTYATSYFHINVSCESCHGKGLKHVEYVESESYKSGNKVPQSFLLAVRDTNNIAQMNSCAPCHSRNSSMSSEPNTSKDLMNQLIPEVISNENYFADGQIKNEDFEFGSFTQSKMFHQNVRCSNCHNPHSGKLLKAGNALCLNCHAAKYNSKEHHFHAMETEASQCINCHMTARTYMGNDTRRDHSFRVPRPDQSVKYNTPNACKNCHANQSNTWASNKVNAWYGAKRKYHFSDDLLPGSLLNTDSEAHLSKLLSDTKSPAIARATAAFYLGEMESESAVKVLVQFVTDAQAQVRYQCLKSLEKYPPNFWQDWAKPCLKDSVKAVRIAAANLFHMYPAAISNDVRSAYEFANNENAELLRSQLDFAVGNTMMADYLVQGGAKAEAIPYYLRTLKKDGKSNYVRFNLSSVYNGLGRNAEAIALLKEVAEIDPKNGRTYYNLGLLYYEEQQKEEALLSFEKALKLGYNRPEVYYNYGLLLQQLGKDKQSESLLLRGYQKFPAAENLNYALAYFYLQKGNKAAAFKHINFLRQIAPNNPKYTDLFGIM